MTNPVSHSAEPMPDSAVLSKQELNKAKNYIRNLVSGSLFVAEGNTVAQNLLLDRAEDEWVRVVLNGVLG